MNLAPYVDVRFGDDEAFEQFLFVHLLTHHNIADYLADQNLKIDNYPLDSIEGQKDWLFTHQIVHNQIVNRLGLSGAPDLEFYDFTDRAQFDEWTALHGQEHDRLLLALGF